MIGWAKAGRVVAAVFCGVVAISFMVLAASMPIMLQEQAKSDQAYYQQFRRAAAFTVEYASRHHGQLPEDATLRSLGDASDARGVWSSLSLNSGDCGDDFKQEARDRFTLSFWRGEWPECFAFPSGKTTLAMSLSGYLRSGLWVDWAIYCLVAVAAGFGSVRLGWRRQSSGTG